MNVLRVQSMTKTGVRWDALNLEHLTDFEDALGHVTRLLELSADLLGQVVGGKSLEVGQAIVEGCR